MKPRPTPGSPSAAAGLYGAPRGTAADAFYAERDRRTLQYGGSSTALDRPVILRIDAEAAATRAGQVAALALVEMLSRVHRNFRIETPDTPVLCRASHPGNLATVLRSTATAIDPYLDSTLRPADAEPLVVLVTAASETVQAGQRVVARWRGGRGEVHVNGHPPPAPAGCGSAMGDDRDVLGAATAAVLAAAATFRLAHGNEPRSAAANLLERTADHDATTASLTGPIEVGDVLIVGAGAVGHALAYWSREFGHTGQWTLVDGDRAELHNTNRNMGMTAADAGWRDHNPNGVPAWKVQTAARLIGALARTMWFHDLDYVGGHDRPDLILPLANEHGIRQHIASLGEPLLLHASTSSNWTAELHRHVAGRDDCPACRIPNQVQQQFVCSAGSPTPGSPASSDAALSFLSSAAGLMLAVALMDLQHRATLLVEPVNHWRLHLELGHRLWQQLPHDNRCRHVLAADVRQALQTRAPRRWDHVS